MLTCKAWSKLFHWLIEYLKTSMYVHFEFYSFHANSGVKTSSACVLINILSNLQDKYIAFLGLYEISVYIYIISSFFKKVLFYFPQVKETQHSVRDSESGLHRMAIGHHLGKVVILPIVDNFVSVIAVLQGFQIVKM